MPTCPICDRRMIPWEHSSEADLRFTCIEGCGFYSESYLATWSEAILHHKAHHNWIEAAMREAEALGDGQLWHLLRVIRRATQGLIGLAPESGGGIADGA